MDCIYIALFQPVATRSALQYGLTFTHSCTITHSQPCKASASSSGAVRVRRLAKGHLATQLGGAGDQTGNFPGYHPISSPSWTTCHNVLWRKPNCFHNHQSTVIPAVTERLMVLGRYFNPTPMCGAVRLTCVRAPKASSSLSLPPAGAVWGDRGLHAEIQHRGPVGMELGFTRGGSFRGGRSVDTLDSYSWSSGMMSWETVI